MRSPNILMDGRAKLCVVCQKEAEPLVLHPRLTSYHNLLEAMKERASLHDADCVPVQKRLKECTAETLQRENAVWHHTCYSRMTNTVQRERTRDRQQHFMSTASSTRPLNKDTCFFCQTDNDQKPFTVRTGIAGQALLLLSFYV